MKKCKDVLPVEMPERVLMAMVGSLSHQPTARTVNYAAKHITFLIGIGKDHTADITMEVEAYEELCRRCKA